LRAAAAVLTMLRVAWMAEKRGSHNINCINYIVEQSVKEEVHRVRRSCN